MQIFLSFVWINQFSFTSPHKMLNLNEFVFHFMLQQIGTFTVRPRKLCSTRVSFVCRMPWTETRLRFFWPFGWFFLILTSMPNEGSTQTTRCVHVCSKYLIVVRPLISGWKKATVSERYFKRSLFFGIFHSNAYANLVQFSCVYSMKSEFVLFNHFINLLLSLAKVLSVLCCESLCKCNSYWLFLHHSKLDFIESIGFLQLIHRKMWNPFEYTFLSRIANKAVSTHCYFQMIFLWGVEVQANFMCWFATIFVWDFSQHGQILWSFDVFDMCFVGWG